jgi:hypothetical protein
VRAEILGHEVPDVAVIPRAALQRDQQVFVVTAEGRLQLRPVTVLRADEGEAYIAAGLEQGERVLLTALELPVEGMRVRVAEGQETP